MKFISSLSTRLAIASLATVMITGAAFAAGTAATPPRNDWSFSGPFGKYDETQLQRGFKVFQEVCSGCHSMNKLAFRNLSQEGGPRFTNEQVNALAATFMVKDGPNENGDYFERAARPADLWPAPYPNKQASQAANGGAYPPDFSVIAKARTYERGFPNFVFDIFTQFQEQGVDYISALLNGYAEAPAGFNVPDGKYYNVYMPGNVIAMSPPIQDGQVSYEQGADGQPQAPETAVQYAKDVSAFLMWVAEPHLEQRKEIAFKTLVFLLVFAGLLYFTNKKIWSNVQAHA